MAPLPKSCLSKSHDTAIRWEWLVIYFPGGIPHVGFTHGFTPKISRPHCVFGSVTGKTWSCRHFTVTVHACQFFPSLGWESFGFAALPSVCSKKNIRDEEGKSSLRWNRESVELTNVQPVFCFGCFRWIETTSPRKFRGRHMLVSCLDGMYDFPVKSWLCTSICLSVSVCVFLYVDVPSDLLGPFGSLRSKRRGLAQHQELVEKLPFWRPYFFKLWYTVTI